VRQGRKDARSGKSGGKGKERREAASIKHRPAFPSRRASWAVRPLFDNALVHEAAGLPSVQTLLFSWQGKRGWPLVRLSLRNLVVVAVAAVVAAQAYRTSYGGSSPERGAA
jgi:hypothetical protein